MLIINQFKYICHWKAPAIMLLHKPIYHPLCSLLQSQLFGKTTASIAAWCAVHSLKQWRSLTMAFQEVQKESLMFIYWHAKRPGLQLRKS